MTEDEGPDESPDVESPTTTLPYATPSANDARAAARSRQVLGVIAGLACVGLIGAACNLPLFVPHLERKGGVLAAVRPGWHETLPLFIGALAVALVCALIAWFLLSKRGRRGFIAGALIGACLASLLSGICFLGR